MLALVVIVHSVEVMALPRSNFRANGLVMPIVIGATCAVGAVGLYYFYRTHKKAISNDNTCIDDMKINFCSDLEGEQRTIKIEFWDLDKNVSRSRKYDFRFSHAILGVFKELEKSSVDKKIKSKVIKNDPILTATLLKRLFGEVQSDNMEPVLIKDQSEYAFFIDTMHIFGASEEFKKKIAVKYCLPNIEELLSSTPWSESWGDAIWAKKLTIDMTDYLPDEIKADLEDRLYSIRFQTKQFKQLREAVDTIYNQVSSLMGSFNGNKYGRCYDINDVQIKYPKNARQRISEGELCTMLPILSSYASFKAWHGSFPYRLYEKLIQRHQDTITCYEFSEIKRSYPLSQKENSPVFICNKCNTEYRLPLYGKIDSQNTIACKNCVNQTLNGRKITLYDGHNLDCVSLSRLTHRAYGWNGFYGRIEEEESAVYEDLPHSNRLHLPLLQLLIKYHRISYNLGDGYHGWDAYLHLGTCPVLLDQIDIETLPLFRDSCKSDRITYKIEHENEINELLQLTLRVIRSNPSRALSVTYTKQGITYHVYHDRVTMDLTDLRNYLAEYFWNKHTGQFGNSSNKQRALVMEKEEKFQEYNARLKNITKQFDIDYKILKQQWRQWYCEKKNDEMAFTCRTEIAIQLPIKTIQ